MLPHLVILAVTIATLGFGSRWIKHEITRVDDQLARLQEVLARAHGNRMPHLQLDPATGVYRPMKRVGWQRRPRLSAKA